MEYTYRLSNTATTNNINLVELSGYLNLHSTRHAYMAVADRLMCHDATNLKIIGTKIFMHV